MAKTTFKQALADCVQEFILNDASFLGNVSDVAEGTGWRGERLTRLRTIVTAELPDGSVRHFEVRVMSTGLTPELARQQAQRLADYSGHEQPSFGIKPRRGPEYAA